MEGTNFPVWQGTRTSALPGSCYMGPMEEQGGRCMKDLVNPREQLARWIRVHKPVDVTCEAPLPVCLFWLSLLCRRSGW